MDTLAVALRVAEEAIEEAISKAEAYGDSLVWTPCPLWGGVGRGPGCQKKSVGCQETSVNLSFPQKRLYPNLPSNQPFSSLPLQDKQNEASYLRDHKEELTEELATTILQKVGGPAIR